MRRHALVVLAALLVTGCGSGPSPSPSSEPASVSASPASGPPAASVDAPGSAPASPPQSGVPSPSASDAPTDAPSPSASPAGGPSAGTFELPETPVTGVLDQAYNTTGDPFDPADVGGVGPGDVTARWYVADDRWVVHYDGLDPAATGPLCPGSSAQTAAGFEHVTNAPTDPGGCEGFDATLAAGPVGVRRCGSEVLYLTAIPADVEGTLFASIETRYEVEGSVVGLTGMAGPTDGQPPVIDLDDPACEVVPARP
jgi:hypothetical protein